ncbi:MAG: response regulator transcription factor [Bacteroides sp.]|nr:response regulator transcription factor [Bacteroides sp.]
MKPEIAIIEPNTLALLGLQRLIEEIIPVATVRAFRSFSELMDDTPDMYAHYFVASQVYFEHTTFFLERRPKSIVLASGECTLSQLGGITTLNTQQSEHDLVKSILQLHNHGHHHAHQPLLPPQAPAEHDLSPREIEVLVLLTRGFINKEIADRLNISLTTVITHRKNISEKLGIKSLSGLTIYAVMRGYVEVDSL